MSIGIKSIKKVNYSGKVYNLAVEKDESYIVNKIVVHNCRSTLVPVFKGEEWIESETLDVKREF